jgi:hypothetical protein
MPKNAEIYECKLCDFSCSKKSNWAKHILTQKHKNNENGIFFNKNGIFDNTLTTKKILKCPCGKTYKDRAGLWRHKQKMYPVCSESIDCTENTEKINIVENQNTKDELVKILVEENKKLVEGTINLKELMIEQNQDFKNLILEIFKNIQPSQLNNNSNNITNSNNKFNLQFFLNETCKNAMNLNEFVDSIQLQLTDLENVGRLGYVEGISNIIIKNLNALKVHERPVHCNDFKRESMYVKIGNIWEKESENKPRLKKAVKQIANKNILLINQWREKHPDYSDYYSKRSNQFNTMVQESIGGLTQEENDLNDDKIIKRIAKTVIIDKCN